MIHINNLTKKYAQTSIFENLSFTFPNKGLICILGASGCGKSTLLNMLAGLDTDYSGDITVLGVSISEMNANELCNYRRDNVGFVFQNYHLLSGYTVVENVLFASELNTLGQTENQHNAHEFIDKLGLSSKVKEKVENLSGGEKQRVAIARALINNPSVILADEPTGALDRKNSMEIMELLKQTAKDRLVLVITHDSKCAEFADQTIIIQNGQLVTDKAVFSDDNTKAFRKNSWVKVSALKRGLKNFKVHLSRYMAVSLAISIGILCFILSLSSGNIMEKSIGEFKEKNTAFNNGYIKIQDGEKSILEILKGEKRIENVYEQFLIDNVSITIDGRSETMAEKYPMPKATEKMSYGIMPKEGRKEMALSPSLAAKFSSDIKNLIGKKVTLEYHGQQHVLTISGIFNADYDDFFVSSDIEKQLYKNIKQGKVYSVSYDVVEFDEIVAVSHMLKENGYESKNASAEVGAFQKTFQNLRRLFLWVSLLILAIGVFISAILLVKLQNSRVREMGLLSALGYSKNTIVRMIISENVLLSITAAIFNCILVVLAIVISNVCGSGLEVTLLQLLLSVCITAVAVITISVLSSLKLIRTEPAQALRQ